MQIVEILGILPNRARKGTRSRILTSKPEDDYFGIQLPGTEIPKWLNLNHESDGNVISFWVGRTFPNIFYVCFAFGPVKYPLTSLCYVDLSINGRKKKNIRSAYLYKLSDNLWIFSLSNNELQNQLNGSNPSELNYVEVICEMEDWVKNHPTRWGVGVECICQWASNNGGGSRHQCEEETIDQPMQDVPKNTTCPILDGFESNSNTGNGALVKHEFQVHRSCPGSLFFFIIHSLCLKNQRKGNKQVFSFFGRLKGSEGNGRDRSQGFQQWSRRFRAFNRPHLC